MNGQLWPIYKKISTFLLLFSGGSKYWNIVEMGKNICKIALKQFNLVSALNASGIMSCSKSSNNGLFSNFIFQMENRFAKFIFKCCFFLPGTKMSVSKTIGSFWKK